MLCILHRVTPRLLSVSMLTMALGGCAQMTKHSNTMVFATDTGIGIKVGQDVNQMPAIEIGYSRQEAALVPLLANTSVESNGQLAPCSEVITSTNTLSLSGCHFRATHNGDDRDAYSTMASFGTKVSAGSDTAGMAVAQFFATGIAAQHLTLAGGANLVQVSNNPDVAKANGEAAGKAADALRAHEITNAAAVQVATDQGRVAAKLILGAADSPVTNITLTALAAEIAKVEPAGCTVSDLDDLNQESVNLFLDEMAVSRSTCLRRLNTLIEQ